MAAAMISDRGLRKKITQEVVKEAPKPPPKKASKRRSTASSKPAKVTENNNNHSKKPKIVPNGDGKEDLFAAYQPWVIQAYGDLAKTKTITLRKYSRILKALRGEDLHSSDSSKFRFWVKAKGFHLGQPPGYDAKPADGIVCRYSALDVDGGQESIDRCSGSAGDPALYVPTAPVKNAAFQDPVYRKVAIVEDFFDIIYTVHVDLEGRAGKHAGQKRTYRTITETYAFLPREAVTRFLMGCLDCQRRPRSLSPAAPLGLPPGRSRSPTIPPNGFHQLTPLTSKPEHHLTKNGTHEISTKNWENEIDASQPALKISFTDGLAAFDTTGERSLRYLNPSQDIFTERTNTNGIDLANTLHPIPNGISPNKIGLFDSGLSAFRSVRKDASKEDIFDFNNSEEIDTGEAKTEPYISGKSSHSIIEPQRIIEIKAEQRDEQHCEVSKESCVKVKEKSKLCETNQDEAIAVSEKPKKKPAEKEAPRKPYNPLDVCNLTSKDPPKSRTPPKKRLNPIFNKIEENGVDSKSFSKAWSPSMQSMFSPHRLSTEGLGSNQKAFLHGVEIDYSVPITTTYLKHMRSLGYSAEESMKISNKESLNQDHSDVADDDHFSGLQMKDADKVKLLLLAWNLQGQKKARNGDADGGGGGGGVGDTNMAELWASYHSALGLSGAGGASSNRRRDQPSPVLLGTGSEGPGGVHDETSSSAGNGKEDEDTLASDDESDDRLDPQHHDPERLKAFNMFVRLFVDENLDRMVPISKQPKEKIQAIIDSCTRQFPEFAERARKRIRTYLKSCRRNKKVRDGNASAGTNTPAWDATIRPTPAHLTSVQAEQILAQACENESHNAKRMRLGLEPVSQPMPTTNASLSMDTTAPSAPHGGLLGVFGSSKGQEASAPSGPTSLLGALHNGGCHSTNNIKDGGSKSASPASSPALPLFRTNFPQSFGLQQGRQSSRTSTPSVSLAQDFAPSLGGVGGGAGGFPLGLSLGGLHGPSTTSATSATSAAVQAYQNALFSAMAHQGQGLNFGGLGVALTGNGPTDLSMKNTSVLSSAFPSSLSSATAASALGLSAAPALPLPLPLSHAATKPSLLAHKLNTAEMVAVRQLITGYRESAAFLLRSADELETLLLQQP